MTTETAIIMELGEIDLDGYFSEKVRGFDETKFLFIVKQMLLGLKEVHSAGQSVSLFPRWNIHSRLD